jgi:hypothetical protein
VTGIGDIALSHSVTASIRNTNIGATVTQIPTPNPTIFQQVFNSLETFGPNPSGPNSDWFTSYKNSITPSPMGDLFNVNVYSTLSSNFMAGPGLLSYASTSTGVVPDNIMSGNLRTLTPASYPLSFVASHVLLPSINTVLLKVHIINNTSLFFTGLSVKLLGSSQFAEHAHKGSLSSGYQTIDILPPNGSAKLLTFPLSISSIDCVFGPYPDTFIHSRLKHDRGPGIRGLH